MSSIGHLKRNYQLEGLIDYVVKVLHVSILIFNSTRKQQSQHQNPLKYQKCQCVSNITNLLNFFAQTQNAGSQIMFARRNKSRTIVCADCLLFGNHKAHDPLRLHDALSELQQEQQDLAFHLSSRQCEVFTLKTIHNALKALESRTSLIRTYMEAQALHDATSKILHRTEKKLKNTISKCFSELQQSADKEFETVETKIIYEQEHTRRVLSFIKCALPADGQLSPEDNASQDTISELVHAISCMRIALSSTNASAVSVDINLKPLSRKIDEDAILRTVRETCKFSPV